MQFRQEDYASLMHFIAQYQLSQQMMMPSQSAEVKNGETKEVKNGVSSSKIPIIIRPPSIQSMASTDNMDAFALSRPSSRASNASDVSLIDVSLIGDGLQHVHLQEVNKNN